MTRKIPGLSENERYEIAEKSSFYNVGDTTTFEANSLKDTVRFTKRLISVQGNSNEKKELLDTLSSFHVELLPDE